MNTDDMRKLFGKEINDGKGDLADTYRYELTNPLVQAAESLRLLVMALHQGSPSSISEQMEKLTQMVSPFSDYAEKIVDDLADEIIQENNADLTLDRLEDDLCGSEISIDEYQVAALQDQSKELTTFEQSSVIGLLLAVCAVNALPHSSALYSSSASDDPQQMARQCQQECQEANRLDKSIRSTMDSTDICNLYDKIAQLIDEIYNDGKSPAAKQHAKLLAELSARFKATADSTLQFAACAHLNVLNARQFVDDLAAKIEDDGLADLKSIVVEANSAFNKLLDDISPALFGMLLTNCVAGKLLAQVS